MSNGQRSDAAEVGLSFGNAVLDLIRGIVFVTGTIVLWVAFGVLTRVLGIGLFFGSAPPGGGGTPQPPPVLDAGHPLARLRDWLDPIEPSGADVRLPVVLSMLLLVAALAIAARVVFPSSSSK